MDSKFISSPTDFQRMEGSSVDFKKTFNLSGVGEDETLRLYLLKAGLSDDIEYLTPEQRRAFIYDIIKSNKMPGYWMPSTMKSSSAYNYPTSTLPTSHPVPPTYFNETSPATHRQQEAKRTPPQTLSYASMNTSSSSGSLKSLDNASSPIVPRRFQPTPPTPPSPSTFVTSLKGSKYEISGPMNFQHVAGDMTRDMTRNAFDLNMSLNDNVLKKYMRERGITDEELSGMRKQDIICSIVQSKFTWMPPKRQSGPTNTSSNAMYATVTKRIAPAPPDSPQVRQMAQETTVQSTPSPPPQSISAPNATGGTTITDAKTDLPSNYNFLASRFADPSEFPSPDTIFGNNAELEEVPVNLPLLPPQTSRPAPPPRKPRLSSNAAPPPPSFVTANNNEASMIYHSPPMASNYDAMRTTENLYETIADGGNRAPTLSMYTADSDFCITQNRFKSPTSTVKTQQSTPFIPPPPPPSLVQPSLPVVNNVPSQSTTYVPSKKSSNTIGVPPPPPPPPPPPAPTTGAPLPPPPPPQPKYAPSNNVPLPLAPPMAKTNAASVVPPNIQIGTGGEGELEDSRDALLESIRKGVTLKKVDKKAATISGIKPRAERRPPPVNDFLSELKMGITLRRVKNPEHNPFAGADPDESHA